MMDFRLPTGTKDDLTAFEKRLPGLWSEYVRDSVVRLARHPRNEGHSFFLPDGTAGCDELPVVWSCFPESLRPWHKTDEAQNEAADALAEIPVGYRATDDGFVPVMVPVREYQDEYGEWFVERAGDEVRRVTFTAESPEYWHLLARTDPTLWLVAELYSRRLGRRIVPAELMWPYDVLMPSPVDPSGWVVVWPAGSYNPYNDWNAKSGIVHCTHPDNTLLAAAMLVAAATVKRVDAKGEPIVESHALLCASGYGNPNRLSDPAIGAKVSAQVHAGCEVGIADPPGIYLEGLHEASFTDPDGKPLQGLWRSVVGEGRDTLRAVFEVPDELDHVLADGAPVTTGSQVARHVRLRSTVLTRRRADGGPPPRLPIAACLESPERPGLEGVFFADRDWPVPADRRPAPPAPPAPPAEPAGPSGPRAGSPRGGGPGGAAPGAASGRWGASARWGMPGRWGIFARWGLWAIPGRWGMDPEDPMDPMDPMDEHRWG